MVDMPLTSSKRGVEMSERRSPTTSTNRKKKGLKEFTSIFFTTAGGVCKKAKARIRGSEGTRSPLQRYFRSWFIAPIHLGDFLSFYEQWRTKLTDLCTNAAVFFGPFKARCQCRDLPLLSHIPIQYVSTHHSHRSLCLNA